MARGPAVKIILGDSERSELEMRARRRKIARVDAVRAEIVLLAADGMNNCAIAATLGVSRLTVGLWRKRFAKKRFDGLDDEPHCGAPRKIGDEKIAEVVTKTLETHRSEGNTLRHPSGTLSASLCCPACSTLRICRPRRGIAFISFGRTTSTDLLSGLSRRRECAPAPCVWDARRGGTDTRMRRRATLSFRSLRRTFRKWHDFDRGYRFAHDCAADQLDAAATGTTVSAS